MTSRIRAINANMPDIQLGDLAGLDDLVELIARSTGLNEGTIHQVLTELRDAVFFYARRGQPVQLEGLGIYTPYISLEGEITVGHRADTWLKNQLNGKDAFKGTILRSENIGKTGDELVAMWNADHPEDPVA